MATLEILKLRCDEMLEAMVGIANGAKWWNTPNKAFGMKTPKEHWDKAPHEVYVYLFNYLQR